MTSSLFAMSSMQKGAGLVCTSLSTAGEGSEINFVLTGVNDCCGGVQ